MDAGRVWDAIAAAQYVSSNSRIGTGQTTLPVHIAGQGAAGVIAAYAAALNDQIASVTVVSPPATHMDRRAPQLLNALRVCDIPDVLGLIAPRSLTMLGAEPAHFDKTTAAYTAAMARDRSSFK